MKNTSSEERYNLELWYVLDKINYQLLCNKKDKVISYMIYPNPLSKQEVSFIRQQEILRMLEDEEVIIKKEGISGTSDPDVLEIGEEGTSKYRMFLQYYFEPTDKFDKYYEKYKKTVNNTYVKNDEKKNNTSVKLDNQSNKKNDDPPPIVALQLFLTGDRLCITGSAVENQTIELKKIRGGSSSLVEPVLKVCKNHPYTFKTITFSDLQSKTDIKSTSLENSTKNIPLFKSYLSNIGLKGELRKLFYGNSPEGLGFKFRISVMQEEWNGLSETKQQIIVNMLNKKAVSE